MPEWETFEVIQTTPKILPHDASRFSSRGKSTHITRKNHLHREENLNFKHSFITIFKYEIFKIRKI